MNLSNIRTRKNILDKPLSEGNREVSLSSFSFLFSEIVQYCQSKADTVQELEDKLSEMGQPVGYKLIDLLFIRERGCRRVLKVLYIICCVRSTLWLCLFGKEADKLERATDNDRIYFIVEKEPLVNKFISVPKDKGNLNCAAFIAGIIEGFITGCGFPAKVKTLWAQGTTFMITFEESVIARDKEIEEED